MRIVIRLGIIFNLSLVLVLSFIFLGDKILPKVLAESSVNTRITIHKAIAKFVANEKKEFSRLKGGETTKKREFKLHKPGTYFDKAVNEAEKQTNVSH